MMPIKPLLAVTALLLLAGTNEDMSLKLRQLQKDLNSPDATIRHKAVTSVVNLEFHDEQEDRLVDILLPLLRKPALDDDADMTDQTAVMAHLASRHAAKSKAALPFLLPIIADDKLPPYLRGRAIEAAGKIGPGDAIVVDALIKALENPNPKNESGVHSQAIKSLVTMGKAAWPAKIALASKIDHPWFQDDAFDALGKLALVGESPTLHNCLAIIREPEKASLEESAAAFLTLSKGSALDSSSEIVERLWDIVEKRENDVYSRAALRTLLSIGRIDGLRAAKLITRAMFLPYDSQKGNIWLLAEQALRAYRPTDKQAAVVFAQGLAKGLDDKNNWTTAWDFARALAKFGKDAQPATPYLIRGLRGVESYEPHSSSHDLFDAYTDALGGLDGNEPGVRQTILELLDARSPIMKKSGTYAPIVEEGLLGALAKLNFPPAGAAREQMWKRVVLSMKSDYPDVVHHALQVIEKNPELTPAEVKEVIPLLTRLLAFEFQFAKVSPIERGPTPEIALGYTQKKAIETIAALGPAAAATLPELNSWAARDLLKSGGYSREPPANATIRAARSALERVKAK